MAERTSRWPDNRLVLTGRLLGEPDVRQTPAGLKIVRLRIEHGENTEGATADRRPFQVTVRVAAPELLETACRLRDGDQVRVTGSLMGMGHRTYRTTLEIDARGLHIADPANE
ncbi:primosomal replication protein N [Natronocella acetinitrilica]|uniref:Primosomal replication protein N n=1 Tax=Natronocella acetinitrilica TaxID=414046 RepID=A0AAE3KG98_9GAMM|nr:single-stranded DNA-binding protein [Natronocella acetinitrilica]MCP1675022.1 primosomal replication protein N [Natronocella acetinitrilica]